jgi:hypothetical protein
MSKYAYLAIGLAVLTLLAGSHWKAYVAGGDSVRAEWGAEKLAAETRAETLRLLSQGKINRIDRAGVARAQKQAAVDQSILEKVEINVPSTLPMLPGSFRLQHDAAAAGKETDDTGAADADPVAPRTVAKTLTRNYADARSDKQNLEELQAIVRASGCFDTEGE